MLLSIPLISISLLTLASATISATSSQIPMDRMACVESSEILESRIDVYGEECPPDTKNNPDERHYNGPELNLDGEPRQMYRLIYDPVCSPGLESASGCDSNPDYRRCADGTFPYRQIIEYVGGPNDGIIQGVRTVCPEDPEFEDGVDPQNFIEEIRITPEQFRSFPILPSDMNSDPAQFSLRNGHTHLWAVAETQAFNTNMNGVDIEVRAIPVQWMWDYGDGTKRNFSQPGEPAPNHTLHHETPTSHSYTETGIFEVNLTTLYRGEFRIVGEGWQPIPGQAAVASDPIPIDVWRTEKELVAPDGQ